MSSPAQPLLSMKRENDFLICIDSDGCVFDTMEVKHKECFIPNTINYWDLQSISKYGREAAEFVNLYSKSRGINRFPALVEVIDLLGEREECKRRGYRPPDLTSLRAWIKAESKLGNPALIAYVQANPDDALMKRTLEWSLAVNRAVTEIVRGVPPFPFVRESLEAMQGRADVIIVSATPNEALIREWEEHDVARYVKVIAGQEMGTKKECIALAKKLGYAADNVLMIGDAPGDLSAARGNDALFFPINPGAEDGSWQVFYEAGLEKFFSGEFAGEYERALVAEFDRYLPDTPPWKKESLS